MENFIRDENIKLYRLALLSSTDDGQKDVLLTLLGILMANVPAAGAAAATPDWSEALPTAQPPSRQCDVCQRDMSYLAELPATLAHGVTCVFRCMNCNAVVSTAKPRCSCVDECLSQTYCVTPAHAATIT
ncbi:MULTISPECIES: hypothetical protein [Rhodopseudomonas]|uniref:Uncharacterized protein n=1 Tax=Rhodopseudomonas palustris TaxID=1076 RepID=A0A0D7EJI3_RHOPL|nr:MULTISPECIES: hypothetical protein [Rhodopseudomonas]KIZ39662.1 hypothetical protein OO17_19730 [Rhodopseudomonas palustris]MDF3810420.1 hypothetical protein [Rhodopseudomonas sp. BAL398]WOK19600.1 hypothetical protein RBJ75_08815 [Rhodopseudomonas sp. BAL398]